MHPRNLGTTALRNYPTPGSEETPVAPSCVPNMVNYEAACESSLGVSSHSDPESSLLRNLLHGFTTAQSDYHRGLILHLGLFFLKAASSSAENSWSE